MGWTVEGSNPSMGNLHQNVKTALRSTQAPIQLIPQFLPRNEAAVVWSFT